MLIYGNSAEGRPTRLYRRPDEVRDDIAEISERIKETDEMLSVHSIIVNLLSEWAIMEPHKWISELEESVAEARDALENLKKLGEALEDLKAELGEISGIMGI